MLKSIRVTALPRNFLRPRSDSRSMTQTFPFQLDAVPLDAGLRALCGIAAYYHVAADPAHLSRELALQDRQAGENDIVRAAMLIGLKAKLLVKGTATRLATLPTPAIVRLKNGSFQG